MRRNASTRQQRQKGEGLWRSRSNRRCSHERNGSCRLSRKRWQNPWKPAQLDELKIDKRFVSSVLERPADLAIVRAMVSLAGGLDLTVTAEGVEDEATARLLTDLCGDELQGYLIAGPMRRRELIARTAALGRSRQLR
jgi:hypothetical protein